MRKIEYQVQKYLEWCKDVADMSEQTLISKKYALEHFIKHTEVRSAEDFTNQQFITWRNGLLSGCLTGRKYCVNSVNVRIKIVRAFLKWAQEYYELKMNIKIPFLRLVRQEKIKDYIFYSKDQIDIVLSLSNVKEKAMISLLFDTGMRIDEMRKIRIEDFDFDRQRVLILGKGRKYATVFFTNKTRSYIYNYMNENNINYGFLFQSKRNDYQPYTKDALRVKMKKAFERAGFKNFTPHQLRHSFATDLIENGATILEVQKLLRHESVTTTETYVHNLQNSLQDVYNRLKNAC